NRGENKRSPGYLIDDSSPLIFHLPRIRCRISRITSPAIQHQLRRSISMTWRLGRSILVLLAVVLASFSLAQADQPQMREAREHLVAARAALVRADANKGGHRQKAIGLVNSAIAEVDRGIAFDRRHNHAQPSASGAPDQPNMRAALDELNKARKNLENAT